MPVLVLYGVVHVVVDACSAAVVFGVLGSGTVSSDASAGLLLLYHAMAFGLQPLFGLAVDATDSPRLATAVGCLIAAAGLLMPWPMAAVITTGIGNALFHVGGGSVALRLTPQRVTAPGLFVAPGSLGLLLGAILGRSGLAASHELLATALLLLPIVLLWPIPTRVHEAPSPPTAGRGEWLLTLVLLAIAIRSLLGFLVVFPWETQPVSLVALTVATTLGKALGGVMADRYGWLRTGVGGTLAAMPLLAAAPDFPAAAIPGLFLLNLSMPVTLTAVAQSMPGRPAFAFGLTCLALLVGALPSLLGIPVDSPWFIVMIIAISAYMLDRGLRLVPSFRSSSQSVPVCK